MKTTAETTAEPAEKTTVTSIFDKITATAILLMTSGIVFAAESAEKGGVTETPDPFGALVRLAGSMILVIGLIFIAAYATRQFFNKTRFSSNKKALSIRQVVNLGARRQVLLMDVGEKTLVVGATSDSIRLLAKLPKLEDEENADFQQALENSSAQDPEEQQ